MSVPLVCTDEVACALDEGRAVVALESTIISHGMPWPDNFATAQKLEQEVRAQGAIPATIALLDGAVHIGLKSDTLERLAKGALRVTKVSRRDMARVLAAGTIGATTVAATMIAAQMAGIRFFATGGIGGVHRGVEQSLDISADLPELARSPVAVVCAGAKSILDLPRTLEYLETSGVPVIGYQSDDFPAFYCRRSGLTLETRVDSAAELAQICRRHWQLPRAGGVLVTNPIPTEDALDEAQINQAIETAWQSAQAENIRGKDVTPYMLASLVKATSGRSLVANIALARNNARVAALAAVAFAALHEG